MPLFPLLLLLLLLLLQLLLLIYLAPASTLAPAPDPFALVPAAPPQQYAGAIGSEISVWSGS